MILFPSKPDRTLLMCFWLSISIPTGLLIGAASTFFFSIPWLILGLISICLILLIGLALPKIISNGYEAWNKAAGLFIRLSRSCLMAVCFYIALIFSGRTDSFMNLKRPLVNKSMWFPWVTPEPEIYSHQSGFSSMHLAQRNWISTFISWAKLPRHLWAFSLLPFIILLKALQTDQRSDFPTSIYTLY